MWRSRGTVRPPFAVTWAALADRALVHGARLSGLAGQRVGLVMQPTAGCFAALAALDDLASDVFLLDDRLDAEVTGRLAQELNLSVVLREHQDFPAEPNLQRPASSMADPPRRGGEGSVTILTSGTSGKPKAATHTWATLARPVRLDHSACPQRWLLTYRPQLYAGLQVVLQCWGNLGTLVVPAPDASPNQTAQLLRDAAVQCCSATPSYWRRLVLFADRNLLRAAPLEQITLGGEVVDQQLLNARCGRSFPRPASRTSTPPRNWDAAFRSRMAGPDSPPAFWSIRASPRGATSR